MKKWISKLGILGFLVVFYACNNTNKNALTTEELNFTIDEEFTHLFARNCCGVTGADGVYSVLLPDGRSIWLMGDSFRGTVNEDHSREKMDPIYVRNAAIVQDGDSMQSLYSQINEFDASWVVHPEALKVEPFHEKKFWFWPGDGFVENGKLKVFLSGFYQAEKGMWGFKWADIY